MASAAVAAMEQPPQPELLDTQQQQTDKPGLARQLLGLPRAAMRRAFRAAYCSLARANKGYGQDFLSGNFAPVSKACLPTPLTAEPGGALPPTLRGAFLRNGPNPFFAPVGGYHWFDGCGVVHAVRLRGDDAPPVYSSHFVETRRLLAEKKAGWPCHPKLGDFVGMQGLSILLLDRLYVSLGMDGGERRRHGNGTANTALAHHANRLLALNEGDLPYALRVACNGLVETIGRVTFSGAFGVDGASGGNGSSNSSGGDSSSINVAPVTSFTAHPKVDPETGIMHAFRYTFDSAPYVYYFAIGPDGLPVPGAAGSGADKGGAAPPQHALTSVPRAVMMHDMAITRRHAVFFDLPLVFDGGRMLKEKQLPFRFAPEHGSRVGLLPFSRAEAAAGGAAGGDDKSAAGGDDGVIWYEADEPFMMFHTAASWEEGEPEEGAPPGVVKVVCGHHHTISLDLDRRCDNAGKSGDASSTQSSSSSSSIPDAEKPHMAMVTLDPATRRCSARRLTKIAGDFPVINPRYLGRKCQWVWFACLSAQPGRTVKWDGIAKLDVSLAAEQDGKQPPEECVVGRIKLPEGVYCGEAVFAPRYEDPSLLKSEDDGFLLTFAHDEKQDQSWFYVFDAATMSSEPLAAFKLPSRVPFGFHGLYTNESQVQAARVAEAADVL